MHPILFKIGSLEMASYGLMTALAYMTASFYLFRRLHFIKLDKDTFWNIIFIAFVAALAGSKLLFLIVSWQELGADFSQRIIFALKNFRYGFVFLGGAVTAVIALIYYIKKKKLPLLQTADFFVVGLPLGHAIGRIGCFLAGCCFGKPTQMPWGVSFTHPHSLVPEHLHHTPLHPTQLYEVGANLILFFILQYYYKKPHKNGGVFAAYVIGYCTIRFCIEFFRGDFRGDYVWGLSPSQLICVIAVVCVAAVWRFLKKEKKHG
ncbi:MAG: prolipoprotein diacylglyceryl transferase [Elusimicrobiaceae bacterium]|nr:prolipoprotein diacylglyceryl transferase [Elusimicrobiaceae bacterium]